jgi:hypothetical protein
MAIVEYYGFTTGATHGLLGFGGAGGDTQVTGGRFNGGYLSCSGNNNSVTRLIAARTKLGWHGSMLSGTLGNFAAMRFGENGVGDHVRLTFTGGNWAVELPGTGTVIDSGVAATSGVWHGVEIYMEIHDTAGVIKLWVNGQTTPAIDQSGIDTRNGGTGIVDIMYVTMPGGGSQNISYSDWVLYDENTSKPIGDVRVESLLPNGNGNSSQLVGSDGNSTDNYLLVDETPYNSDTDYVESSTVGNKDTYAFGNLTPTSGTILAVQARLLAKKTDAGTREFKPVYRSGSTEVDGATMTLTSGYTVSGTDIQETKPGGGAWTISDVNAAEFGVKVAA